MKNILLATAAAFALAALVTSAASAADMPIKMPVKAAPAALWDWTGFYLGGYAGVGVQRSRGQDSTGAVIGELDYTGSGFSGGITAGYNYQFGRNWVAGIEGDFGHLGLGREVTDWNDFANYDSKTSWVGTLRGRIGHTNGPTLSYLTGGVAWVRFEDILTEPDGSPFLSSAKTKTGYTLGSGVETRLGGNWTAKAEYAFIDVGSGDGLDLPGNVFDIRVDKHRYHLMKFGANYQFGGKPQPALQLHNWNGFYAGLVGGSAVADARGADPTGLAGGEIGNNGSGFTAGGLAGYNWQFAPAWVAGIEGDFSWLGIDRSAAQYNDFNPATPRNAMLGVETNWLATLRGRIAYSTGPALLYLTAGGAWADVRDSWQGSVGIGGGPLVSSTKTLSGYTVGGGIETVLAGNWTSRTEYLFVDVGKGDVLTSSTAVMQVDHKFHLFRSGLTYKFGS